MLIKNNKNDCFIEKTILVFLFICISLITFFIFPDSDEKIFRLNTDNNIKSMILYSFNYGNGRFLGNLFDTFFSHMYYLKFLFVAFVLTSITFFLYKLFFDKKPEFLLLIAFFIVVPCEDFIENIYFSFSSFSNFVVPILFFLFSFFLVKKVSVNSKSIFIYALIFIFSSFSCLFSENTSLLFLAFSLLFLFNDIVLYKKLNKINFLFFISTLFGVLLMLFIPKIFGVSDKLDSYRHFQFSLTQSFFQWLYIIDLITELLLPISFLSFSVILYVLRKNKKFLDKICLGVIAGFPLFLVLYNDISYINDYYRLILFISFIIYSISTVFILFRVANTHVKQMSFIFAVMLALSIFPMAFVNVLGTRTFYTTFMIMLIFSLYLVSEIIPEFYRTIIIKNSKVIYISFIFAFFIVTVFLFNDSVRKFDSFVIENETGIKPSVEQFDNTIGTGLNLNMHKFAFENLEYLDPAKVKLWPKENWLDFLK